MSTIISAFQEKIYYPYSFETLYSNPKLWKNLESKPHFQKIIKDDYNIHMRHQERLLGYTFLSKYDIVKEPNTLNILYRNPFLENNVTFSLEKENYIPLMKGIGAGVPITDVTLQMLRAGFEQGKWNPDLLMMLIEPTMYTIMALAEKANIQYRINGDEEEDIDEEDEEDIEMMKQKNLQELTRTKVAQDSKVPAGVVPQEILQKIDSLDMSESLLSREEPEQEEEQSLLARGEQ